LLSAVSTSSTSPPAVNVHRFDLGRVHLLADRRNRDLAHSLREVLTGHRAGLVGERTQRHG